MLIAGDHVPAIPLFDVNGKAEIVAPEQNGPTASNVGVVAGLITISKVVVPAQVGAAVDVGVNV